MGNGSTIIKILLIEDNPGDARLAEEDVDVILLDLGLPDGVGFDTFAKAYAQAPNVPIIVLNAMDDEAMGIKAVKEGAQDFLRKGGIDCYQLERDIRFAIERKRAERRLQEMNNTLEAVIDASPMALFILDREGNVGLWNPAAERIFGLRQKEVLGRPLPTIPPDKREETPSASRSRAERPSPLSHRDRGPEEGRLSHRHQPFERAVAGCQGPHLGHYEHRG